MFPGAVWWWLAHELGYCNTRPSHQLRISHIRCTWSDRDTDYIQAKRPFPFPVPDACALSMRSRPLLCQGAGSGWLTPSTDAWPRDDHCIKTFSTEPAWTRDGMSSMLCVRQNNDLLNVSVLAVTAQIGVYCSRLQLSAGCENPYL
ncbi:hypothetical protein ElyMa_002929900 [Elysia marginata]|uniref:Uncharacterized protein n=1 Tax=Elysia marginata TaxID=1093978 RepID=A0AAV4I903_9GAST|nr:hypothetical protein ElyMa_002929900 [Elysia marginata]